MLYLKCGDDMKKILKVFGIILAVIYGIIAIGLTVCLLNYNDYNITEFGDKSLLLLKDDELKPKYRKGDLAVITKNPNDDIKIGDKIFFYYKEDGEVTVNLGVVVDKEKITKKETSFTLNGDFELSSDYVIGKDDTTKIYHKWGSVLGFLESKFGFLFLIIFPILVLFIYEIFIVINEIKSPDEE